MLVIGTARGHTERGYGIFVVVRKGHSAHAEKKLLRVVGINGDAPDSFTAYTITRTNVTGLRRQGSTAGSLDIALVCTTATMLSTD